MSIDDVIKKSFSEANFKSYLKDTLSLEISKENDFVEIDENFSFKPIVEFEALSDGSYIDVYIVKTNTQKNLLNARVKYNQILRKLAKNHNVDLALMALYNENNPDTWKLSLVVFDNDKTLTNLKRFTFELGKNIPTKTAKVQLSQLNKNSTLEDYKKAFSVEKLSNEFFKEYKKLFYELVEHIDKIDKKKNLNILKDKKNIKNYIKKMMGRIVFLYFVQKKGWLNNDHKFFQNLYKKHCKNDENFFDTVLEKFFLEALNKKRDNDIYEIDGVEYNIPYLNGGLFEEDENDRLDFIVPNEDIKKIFDLFDSYNFTVIEDTPHESEVAVDPEMLGRIFEDLLEDRKEKGAFYTPREIVHYMCRQSLNEYLNTKPKNESELEYLKKIKVLDPAIGSGAFPMGMLHEIVQKRIELGDTSSSVSKIKKEVIHENIYGIDIDPSAVEIAKLRFWLSIVVDEDKPEPLPNLFYKIMVGNSLIETIDGFDPLMGENKNGKLSKKQQKNIADLKKLMQEYYNEHKDKKGKKTQIAIKLKQLFDTKYNTFTNQLNLTQDNVKEVELANKISNILNEIKTNHYSDKIFLYKLFFKDVLDNGGFDVVIGNPPYIMEYENKNAFDGLHNSPCYQGKADIWHIFVCKGIDLLKDGGIITYIAKNQWLSSSSASKMRRKIYEDTELKYIIDFGANMIFENADVQTMIFLAQKNRKNKKHKIHYIKFEKQDVKTIKASLEKNNIPFTVKEIDKIYDETKNLTFSSSIKENILEKIEKKKNFEFDSKKEIIQGIIGGPDKAFIVKKDELEKFNKKEKKYLKMLHTNTGRFYTTDSNKYILYLSKKNFEGKSIDDYPNIKKQLLKYKEQLNKRREVLKGSIQWFHLWWARDENFFKKGAKIIFASRTKGKNFTYTEKSFYGSRNLFFIKSDRVNLKYITALLNSQLFYFYMKERLKHTGDLLQIDKNQFMKIPLFVPKDTKSFENIVDKIIELKKQDKDTQYLEDKINKMVYELYGLSQDEIKIVEGIDEDKNN